MTSTARTDVAANEGEGLEVDTSERPLSPITSSAASEVRDEHHSLQGTQDGAEEEEEEEEEESVVERGEESGDEEEEGVGQLLRATVEELEGALQDSRQLLAARDKELSQLKGELDRYRQQAAREIANKTRLAQALDQSQSHTSQLEGLLQGWQLELQEYKIQNERLQAALSAERGKAQELEGQVIFSQEKDRQIGALKSELEECRILLSQQKSGRSSSPGSAGSPTSPIDCAQQQFLKQAIYHLLTDFHAEEQLRAIVSILDFSAKERIVVYRTKQEKGGLYK